VTANSNPVIEVPTTCEIVEIDVLDAAVVVCLDLPTLEALVELGEFDELHDELLETWRTSGGFVRTLNHAGTGMWFVLMCVGNTRDVGVVAHECVHAAFNLVRECGIEVSVDNDEMIAYLTGYIYRAVSGPIADRAVKGRIPPLVSRLFRRKVPEA
jgi:hypothetical protein